MDENRKALEAELKALRKGAGVTLTKLARSVRLMQALGCDSPQSLRGRLDELTKEHDALRHAYGFDGDGALLTARRTNYAAGQEIDPKTAEARENRSIEELAHWMEVAGPPKVRTLKFRIRVVIEDDGAEAWDDDDNMPEWPTIRASSYRRHGTISTLFIPTSPAERDVTFAVHVMFRTTRVPSIVHTGDHGEMLAPVMGGTATFIVDRPYYHIAMWWSEEPESVARYAS